MTIAASASWFRKIACVLASLRTLRGEDWNAKQFRGVVNGGFFDLQSPAAARFRRPRICRDDLMPLGDDFLQRRNRKVRRAHEDDAHAPAISPANCIVKSVEVPVVARRECLLQSSNNGTCTAFS